MSLGKDLRLARTAAGLSLRELAKATKISAWRIARIERARKAGATVTEIAILLAAVGLDLRTSTRPGATAHRDHAHAALLERLRALLHPAWDWRVEVPLPNPGDPRSWDAMVRGAGVRIAFEAETGPRDGQELQRRLGSKRRDGGVDHVILVLSDTVRNREFLRAYGSSLRIDFPLSHRVLARALREGIDPGGSGILVL